MTDNELEVFYFFLESGQVELACTAVLSLFLLLLGGRPSFPSFSCRPAAAFSSVCPL